MPDLWQTRRDANRRGAEPLAVRMRPRTLEEFVGQQHFLGEGKLLRRMLEADRLTSVIFYGPPGTGKTSLAELIARHTGRHFEQANAAAVGVKEVRRILDEARQRLEDDGRRTILFLDEIHRFNRAQQDVLLGDVERGIITLIGATTENPFFSVNSPLVSRSQIFQFQPLTEADIEGVIRHALADAERGYGKLDIQITDEAIEHWAVRSDGDARRALSALEIAVLSGGRGQGAEGPRGQVKNDDSGEAADSEHSAPGPLDPSAPLHIDLDTAEQSIQQKAIVYDATGDEHYDAISAFIKSMRGSDPDASVYWLARMLHAGEDPLFIARRIAILASEDIGNADPRALQIAAAAYTVTERIGMPECQLTLAEAAIYMATAPKSNASAMAIWSAMKDVKEGRTIPVPKHLRDGHYAGAKKLGHAEGYQ
ncbi:MAG: replication-associated recombination protein A, partial [Phycisphaeraceae bacterium]